MKIRFRQSGGFAGLVRGCEVEAAELSPEAEDGLTALRARPPGSQHRGVDRLQFEIIIANDAGTTSAFTFGESAVADDVRPLIAFLQSRSGPVAP